MHWHMGTHHFLASECQAVFAGCRAPVKHIRHRARLVHVTAGANRSSNRTQWAAQDNALHIEQLNHSPAPVDQPSLADPAARVDATAAALRDTFADIDALVAHNLRRVQRAFRAARVGPHYFAGSTGYGHGDLGRAALDEVMASVMGAEAALVRIQFVSGTHAISTALSTVLRPGDTLLAVAGKSGQPRPYDTLEEVIGTRGTPGHGSLREWGVDYQELALTEQGTIDWDGLATAITPRTKVALVQRSCGYALRPTLTIDDIARAVLTIKSQQNGQCIVLVDNCYGEFTERLEPPAVGADLCMGSLIKSPGGTITPGGGYVAGRADLVAAAAARLTAPGVGVDAGCVPGETLRLMFQGLFLAPQMVGEALKGGRLVAQVMTDASYLVTPLPTTPLSQPSFITAVRLGTRARMVAFCRAVQRCCPVGSYVQPVPGLTPGYGDEVIFADGTFIDGSTAELSADGPLREPYVVYCQGGTHWTHWAYAMEAVLEALDEVQDHVGDDVEDEMLEEHRPA